MTDNTPLSGNLAARPLTGQDYKTLSLAALGGALEFYDFIIFVFFANVIGQLFFPPEMPEWLRLLQTFGIFAAGYLARPLGGIVMAHFGDLLGRKRMFTLSILMMAVPTLAMGLLPTYATIGLAAPLLLSADARAAGRGCRRRSAGRLGIRFRARAGAPSAMPAAR
jgi:MFS family permease